MTYVLYDFCEVCTEPGMFMYIYNSLLGYIGFFMFIWWWLKVGDASVVYKYVTFLMLAFAVEKTIAGVSRYYLLIDDIDAMKVILNSALWKLRTIPTAVVLTAIIVSMALRIYSTVTGGSKYKRRIGDKK